MTASHDVAVVGDGPAGSALAKQLADRGVDVELVGADRAWSATYASWVDDLDGISMLEGHEIWSSRVGSVAATFRSPRTIDRTYGVLDNDRLRDVLRRGVAHRIADVADARDLDARIVIDATGWPSGLDPSDRLALRDHQRGPAWQTAFGAVLPEPPSGPLGEPTLMDFGEPPERGDLDRTTFAYSLPVTDGWLVEETVLAGPLVDVDRLAVRLASRLGLTVDALLARSRRVERVRIPMGVRPPDPAGPGEAVRFGAAAGMIHTATGYSVAGAIRASDRVAEAIGERLRQPADGHADRRAVAEAVWPAQLRRARHLHDYGLGVILGLDADDIRRFFEAFFDLPEQRWAAYLRIDTAPRELARIMLSVFARADWPLRRALVGGDLRTLFGALRP